MGVFVARILSNRDPGRLESAILNAVWRETCLHVVGWNIKRESRTTTNFAGYLSPSVVCVHNRFDQPETKAKAALRAALVASIKTLPNSRTFLRWNASTGIGDRYHNLRAAAESGDINPASVSVVFDGII